MKDMTVSKALKWIFIAAILSIFSGLGVIGAILGIVAFVLNLLALYGAGKMDSGYHTAFILSIVGIVLSVLSLINSAVLNTIISIVSIVVELGILYFVVTTTCKHLEAKGAHDVAAKGVTVWKINLICMIASVVLLLLVLIVPVIAAVLSVIVGIVSLVGSILYLIFLWKSQAALA